MKDQDTGTVLTLIDRLVLNQIFPEKMPFTDAIIKKDFTMFSGLK